MAIQGSYCDVYCSGEYLRFSAQAIWTYSAGTKYHHKNAGFNVVSMGRRAMDCLGEYPRSIAHPTWGSRCTQDAPQEEAKARLY